MQRNSTDDTQTLRDDPPFHCESTCIVFATSNGTLAGVVIIWVSYKHENVCTNMQMHNQHNHRITIFALLL